MRSRQELVRALIEYEEDIPNLMQELREYGWDSEEELATLAPQHLEKVLNDYVSGKITAIQVTAWANSIERREDIQVLDSHKDTIDEMLFWLANPEINFSISQELAKRVIKNLQNNVVQ